MTLAALIHSYRKDHGLTMEGLAKKSGLSTPYISMLENDKNSATGKPIVPSMQTLTRLAKAMDMELPVLLDELQDIPHVLRETGEISERGDMRKRVDALARDLDSGWITMSSDHVLTDKELSLLRKTTDYMEGLLDVMEGNAADS